MKPYTSGLHTILFVSALNATHSIANTGTDSCEQLFTDTDYQRALPVCLYAANSGDADAQYYTASLYAEGKAITANLNEAAEWYQKAAEQNHAKAQIALATMYYTGQGMFADKDRALMWFKRAATQGDDTALYSLGLFYEAEENSGINVEENRLKAVANYFNAAQRGSAAAQTRVGMMYANGEKLSLDYGEAITWLNKAASQGDVTAQEKLGEMYLKGLGTARNSKQAYFWYSKAAEQGSQPAQNTAAYLLLEGIGISKDAAKAAQWYQTSAQQGYIESQYDLGNLYARGQGVKQDMIKAFAWWNVAASQGHLKAKEYMEISRNDMSGEQIAKAQRLSNDYYTAYVKNK